MSNPLAELEKALAAVQAAHPESQAVDELAVAVENIKQDYENRRRKKTDLVRTMVAETRSQLVSIKGYATFVRDFHEQFTDHHWSLFPSALIINADRVLNLLRSYRDITLCEEDALTLHLTPVDTIKPIGDAAYDLYMDFKSNEQTLVLPQSSVTIQTDEVRLDQIMGILLRNAHLYTPKGGTIEVGCVQEGETVHITVMDDGYGIPADALLYVFDQAYRAENIQKKAPGLGLGLTLAQALVGALGGEIWLESEEGVGTTAHVRLPIGEVVQ